MYFYINHLGIETAKLHFPTRQLDLISVKRNHNIIGEFEAGNRINLSNVMQFSVYTGKPNNT